MPTFQGLITEEGLLELVAYIKSLSEPAAGAPAEANRPPVPAPERKASRP